MTTLREIHGTPVLLCAADGEPIAREQDALDLIGDAGYQGARWVAVPAERFDEAFFALRTRVAGDIVQKFVNYRMGLVVLGDISRHTARSPALRDFVRECNRGGQTWFLADESELAARLRERPQR
ncbi:DUF4180 domain-containing protein [Streptomyces sp. NPDC017941]|uniref:DUF4180 domain-containing protein n=1 Tax=unclassified Streptomyces TaxID=2593676 RepID=UPI0037AE6BEA